MDPNLIVKYMGLDDVHILTMMAGYGTVEGVKLLLEYVADINVCCNGRSPFWYAVHKDRHDIVEFLLTLGIVSYDEIRSHIDDHYQNYKDQDWMWISDGCQKTIEVMENFIGLGWTTVGKK